jgi:hypothetical protein
MQPKPRAETVKPLLPNTRVFIILFPFCRILMRVFLSDDPISASAARVLNRQNPAFPGQKPYTEDRG